MVTFPVLSASQPGRNEPIPIEEAAMSTGKRAFVPANVQFSGSNEALAIANGVFLLANGPRP